MFLEPWRRGGILRIWQKHQQNQKVMSRPCYPYVPPLCTFFNGQFAWTRLVCTHPISLAPYCHCSNPQLAKMKPF
jgi:hypothetical protein